MASKIETLYRQKFPTSAKLFERAKTLFPNGVTHDSRHLKPFPVYVDRASGSRKYDLDGNEIVDYWVGHGALLLGHSHPALVEAVQRQVTRATHPGACHELELEWGEWVRRLVPSAEMVRFTSSGTEATLMAIRVSRIVTGRTKVVKFAGHFHGWHDTLIPAAEAPEEPGQYRVEEAAGVSPGILQDLVVVPPNDVEALERALDEHQPACVIHEGNGSRWGVVPAKPGFLAQVRELTRQKGVVFILDEVITGFRVAPNGYQGVCGVTPDLTTLAKVLAGGLPGGCLAGRADYMQALAFDNPLQKKMRHPGTYNANPLSAAAGIAALKIVATGEPCRRANEVAARLRRELNALFERKGVRWVAYGQFSAVKIHPDYDGPRPDSDEFVPYDGDYTKLDRKFGEKLSHAFRCALLLGGVDWMGWGGSTSSAHTGADVDRTVAAFDQAIDLLREDGLTE